MSIAGIYTFPSTSQVTLEHVREHLIKIERVTQVERWGAKVKLLRSVQTQALIPDTSESTGSIPTLFTIGASHVEGGQGSLVVIESPRAAEPLGSLQPLKSQRMACGYFSSSSSLEALLSRIKHRWAFRQSASIDGFRCCLSLSDDFGTASAGATEEDVLMQDTASKGQSPNIKWIINCGSLSVGEGLASKSKIFVMLSSAEAVRKIPSVYSRQLSLLQTILGSRILPHFSGRLGSHLSPTLYEQTLTAILLELSTTPESHLTMLRPDEYREVDPNAADGGPSTAKEASFSRDLYLILTAVRRATGM